MRTAIDASVLLDILVDDPEHASASEIALRAAASQGALIICDCVLAEIMPALADEETARELLSDWKIELVASPPEAAFLAGAMFKRYLARRRATGPRRVVADFLIGAHARCSADRLLARDRGYYRDHFDGLTLMEP